MDVYLPNVKQEMDGLIFTPINEPIRIGTHETMFKWKPRNKNTIDFLVKKGPTVKHLDVYPDTMYGGCIYKIEVNIYLNLYTNRKNERI